MTLTNEQIQQILDDAPEGAVEIHEWEYYDEDGIICGEVGENAQGQTPYSDAWHHLSDLREILTLRQEVERLKVEVESKNHDIIEAVKKARTQWAREDVASIKNRESEVAARAVKREVYADGYYDGFTDCRSYDFDSSAECEDTALHNADEKAAQRYPDKE